MPLSGARQEDQKEPDATGLRERTEVLAGRVGPWAASAALAFWTSSPHVAWLALAAALLAVTAVLGPRGRGWTWGVGSALLVSSVVAGFAAHRQVHSVVTDFDGYWRDREPEVFALLTEGLNQRRDAGLLATQTVAEAWMELGPDLDVAFLREQRNRAGAAAMALYDPDGRLVLWDGVHRGRVPEDVQFALTEELYHDLPLFGYVYETSITDDGSAVMAAYMLRSSLPEGLGADMGDFESTFYRDTNERIRITEADPGTPPPSEGTVYDLAVDRDRIFSIFVERPVPSERAAEIMARWAGGVALVLLTAWVLLALSAPRRRSDSAAAALALLLMAVGLPLPDVAGVARLFDGAAFALPGPVPLSLGRFVSLSLASFTVVSVLPRARFRLGPWTAGLGVAASFALLVAWIGGGPDVTALAGGELYWVTYQVGLAAVLALAAGVLLALSDPARGSVVAAAAAVVMALALAGGGAAWVSYTTTQPGWWVVLWGLPAVLATFGARAGSGWRRSVGTWSLAAVLGGSAAIPIAWGQRVESRIEVGTERLAELAAPTVPELEASLTRFGVLADSLDREGVEGVALLYDGWRASGLADTGYPVWLQINERDGLPSHALHVGVDREAAPFREALNEAWRSGGVRLHRYRRDDARYILTSTLSSGQVVSALSPPFVVGSVRPGLDPLLTGARPDDVEPLAVIPLLPGEAHAAEPLAWVRTREGWQGELALEFENRAAYHAHYAVTLPGTVVAVARATLLLALDVALFFGFWLVGQALMAAVGGRGLGRLKHFVLPFRARVTLALFGFFALANALFGTVAYRTLSQASLRSARVIAERVGEDASGWYRTMQGSMDRLADQVGAELLEYRDGELREGSVEELVDLGLYEGWTPYPILERLASREVVYEFTESSIGRWEYVTAYRRLEGSDILAAQVPLQAGTSALQTTDLVELLGFFVILGAALSLGLAMLAGRALTRPIHLLQVASERVGAGNLGLLLPEERTDEFGAVFRAFNRMVGRVRRARKQLVRTSRRTQLIMDEAAVGMVALDPSGHVTLVNPRAEELLGGPVVVGQKLPSEGPLGEALAGWLAEYVRGGAPEADAELQPGDRRVRVRARRLGSDGASRGAVVALDDVTDELRAERVLAWGEMARQVAHEVKNPLTPIKLSIQHVRRAWEDGHPDFDGILLKNADAMLLEIERLAGIAQSFSRFGAPGPNVAPLAEVSVQSVVGEVMALYGGKGGGVSFSSDVDDDLPSVVARAPELKEVLVNLLENARLAGSVGTTVTIVGRRGGDASSVTVSVEDDGSGIPPEVLPRVFEPQFSTRSTGTGLGLAIVRRLVESWGGSVSVESAVGRGTVVSVSLRVWSAAGAGDPGRPESD